MHEHGLCWTESDCVAITVVVITEGAKDDIVGLSIELVGTLPVILVLILLPMLSVVVALSGT